MAKLTTPKPIRSSQGLNISAAGKLRRTAPYIARFDRFTGLISESGYSHSGMKASEYRMAHSVSGHAPWSASIRTTFARFSAHATMDKAQNHSLYCHP